jgi:hypothetical protein
MLHVSCAQKTPAETFETNNEISCFPKNSEGINILREFKSFDCGL